MKASELKKLLDALPEGCDPDIATGDEWLPERLLDASLHGNILLMSFDNAPDEDLGEEEGRGFVEHEIDMIRQRFVQLLDENSESQAKADAMLALFLMGHELTSSEMIEIFEQAAEAENTVVNA
ncbi:hypothetical protein DZ860_15185 [Vibrio sinensis]|uniref:Uncharacterized protein n=1 Tax=Vibrio sinensis TaxID=2302434 RepID=A0A3A6QI21_9VIBR|nr:hypothetical protein [Vibrio sinensis]RJX69530.1 hypothetical protein DZ860_15185 [Vibrio sinensis]